VPARTKIRCGRDSASLKRCVPQVGQKRRCILLPLSATLWKSRVSPRTEISVDGKQTDTAAFPAAIYWQRRHQQRRAVRGSALVSYRTAPQRHPPVITEAPPQRQREYGMKLAARPSQRAYAPLSRSGVSVHHASKWPLTAIRTDSNGITRHVSDGSPRGRRRPLFLGAAAFTTARPAGETPELPHREPNWRSAPELLAAMRAQRLTVSADAPGGVSLMPTLEAGLLFGPSH
jgi:hypothetical protein